MVRKLALPSGQVFTKTLKMKNYISSKKSEFTNKYEYFHKQEPSYELSYMVRTADETRKVLRKLKIITTETKWSKYIPHDDLDDLRNFLINGLITSNKTLQELKRAYNSNS